MCDMTHSYVWRDSLTCSGAAVATAERLEVWHEPFIYVPWLIRLCNVFHSYIYIYIHVYGVTHELWCCGVAWKCDVTHLHVCHDSFVCTPWLIHLRGVTHSFVCNDSFICMTLLASSAVWKRGRTHSCMCHDVFICGHASFKSVTWLIYECDMTQEHSCMCHDVFVCRHDAFICVTWLRSTVVLQCRLEARHDAFMCVPWCICLHAMTRSWVWHGSEA